MDSKIVEGGRVDDVFDDGRQIDRVVNDETALVAREDEQGSNQVLRVIDGGSDVSCHCSQVGGRAVRVVEYDVDARAHHCERSTQLMRGVGDEPPLTVECGLEPVEHFVEGLSELVEFVAGAA